MEAFVTEEGGTRPVICIAGPTASGKTGLAIRVAQAMDGEIVNADALQVYADLSILSARPSAEETDSVPHHLFGHVAADTLYSTGAWLREAVSTVADIRGRGRVPVIVGGTGLYFRALLEGLADIPPISQDVMDAVESLPLDRLRAEAQSVDPVAAERILGDDPQRLQRVVAVFRETGRPLSEWQAETHPAILPGDAIRVVLLPDRAALYGRIDARFDVMIAAGALDEARRVCALKLPARAPILKAIGLSHLLSHLDGECDLETAIATAKRDTRRYAKRQMTWLRNRCADWTVLQIQEDRDRFLNQLTQTV